MIRLLKRNQFLNKNECKCTNKTLTNAIRKYKL